MRLARMLPVILYGLAVSGLSACDDSKRDAIRVELTQGAAEFVGVMKKDLETGLAWLQESLEKQVQEDRLGNAGNPSDDDPLPQPQAPAGPEAVVGPEDGPYLFELLKDNDFKKSWLALFEGVRGLPDWIERFNSDGDGPTTPSATVTRGGDRYLLAWVCEPHNCGSSHVRVLFTHDGRDAWGLFINDDASTWLGNPEPWMLTLLERD